MGGGNKNRGNNNDKVTEAAAAPEAPDRPKGCNVELWEIIQGLRSEISSLKATTNLLMHKLDRADRCNDKLHRELNDVKAHSMNENLIFTCTGDDFKEAVGEDSVELVRHFLINVMGIDEAAHFFIPSAHRLGAKRRDGTQRQIIARFPIALELKKILDNTSRLKNSRNFVARQLPPAIRERHQFAMNEFKKAKAVKENKVTMFREKLFVNGKLQAKLLPARLPPRPENPADVPLADGSLVDDQAGSTFTGSAARVTSLTEVRIARDQLLQRQRVAASSDVMYAYRIKGGGHQVTENFDSEFDYGVGLKLLEWMRQKKLENTVCFATRTCSPGYRHIGARRYEIVSQICGEAVSALSH